MRKFLMTTALVLPMTFGAAFAQDAAPLDDPAAQPGVTDTDPYPTNEVEPMASDRLEADPAAGDVDAPQTPAAGDVDAPQTDASQADQDAMATQMAASDKVVQQQAENELRIDWITGTTVEAPDGTNIGSIKDLIVDGETGELKAAIVGVGGFLGIGQKDIALPWDHLVVNFDARGITSEITREEADAAPEYVFRAQAERPATVGTAPATAPMATDPAMAPAADPMSDPAMAPVTDPAADPAMQPATDPAMAPADEAVNPPASEDVPMATEPAALPAN